MNSFTEKRVGQAIPHESANAHVRGDAIYTDDMVPTLANVLHAWPITASVAHARVKAIDLRFTLNTPGVVDVLTREDVIGIGNVGAARQDEPLFPEIVQFHGQPIAWVLGENEASARQGATVANVDLEEFPATLSIEEAIARETYLTEALKIQRLDSASTIEEALVRSPQRLEGQIHIGGQEHFYLETHAALAYVDESNQVMVHASTQHPTETQIIVARVLDLSSHDVICQSLRMGGAFGGKEVQANAWACIAALGAVKSGRPVRVRLDRQRDMIMTGKRHPFLGRFNVGFDDEGHLLAANIELFSDGGWSLDLSRPVLFRAMFHVDNAYLLPNVKVVGRVCRTHKTSQTAFRGFGGPQGMVVIEEILDRVARATNLAPHVVRQRNLYREGERAHYGQTIKNADRIHRIWDRLFQKGEFEKRKAEIDTFNQAHQNKKRGLAITPVKFGISFTTAFFNQAGALVLLYADGSIQVNHGGTEMGQGLHTKMLQIAADALGANLNSIRLMPTRTDKVPNTSATAASSGSDLNGQAVRDACLAIRKRLAAVAASHFGCGAEDIVFSGGKIHPLGNQGAAISFGKLAKQAYLQRVALFATGYYRTPNIHYDEDLGTGKPFHYYACGAAITEVEVDRFTGQYEFRRVDIVHDVGDSLSPMIDRGQIEGGFIQGLGWLTREELVWDKQSGKLLTSGASTYKLPALGECPSEFNVELLPNAYEEGVIHGSKAVGEPPFMLAISAREALRDAVRAFKSESKQPIELACPSTPEAVYWAIENVCTSPSS